jgi:hypothetical protein
MEYPVTVLGIAIDVVLSLGLSKLLKSFSEERARQLGMR